MMRKGDIVLLPFPFTDLSGSKFRPAVILAVSAREVIVAFVTTQLNLGKESDIILSPTSQNGLKKDSVLILDKISTVTKKVVAGKIGDLTQDELDMVDNNLIKIFQIKRIKS